MESLFHFNLEPLVLDLPDTKIIYTKLLQEIDWQQDTITIYGKMYLQQRLTALYGNEGNRIPI